MARTNVNAQGLSSVKGLYEKRGWFYYQPSTPKGAGIPRPKAVALKTRSLMVALELMEHRRFDMEVIRSVKAGTLEEVLPAYHLEKAGDAKHSRRGRQCVLEMFMNHAGNPRVDQITPAMIQAWRKHLTEKGGQRGVPIAHTTMSSYSIVLRAFLNWAVAKGMLTSNPMQRIAIRVNSTRVQEFLTEDEREKLLAAECSDRVSLILYLGFFAGLRSGEMLAMSPNWLWIAEDGGRGTITVQNTPIKMSDGKPGMWQPKGRRCRTIPLHPRLLEFLKGYGMRWPWLLAPENEKWPGELVNSKRYDASKVMRKLAKKVGVRKLTPHMLRHSFATHLAMKGVALAEIAGLLGDTLRVTEEHYAGYQPGKGNPLECL